MSTWPTHADGTNWTTHAYVTIKTVGDEMTPEERRDVLLSAAAHFAERGDELAAATFRRLAERTTA